MSVIRLSADHTSMGPGIDATASISTTIRTETAVIVAAGSRSLRMDAKEGSVEHVAIDKLERYLPTRGAHVVTRDTEPTSTGLADT